MNWERAKTVLQDMVQNEMIRQDFSTYHKAAIAALAEIDRLAAQIEILEDLVVSQNSALASARKPVAAGSVPEWRTVYDNLITRISRVEHVIERINTATEEEED